MSRNTMIRARVDIEMALAMCEIDDGIAVAHLESAVRALRQTNEKELAERLEELNDDSESEKAHQVMRETIEDINGRLFRKPDETELGVRL